MQLQEYINSGILEQYCLGLLTSGEQEAVLAMSNVYPEVKRDLEEIELAMQRLAFINAITPKIELKQQIVNLITTNDQAITLDNLPATNKYSNYKTWLNAVEHLIPNEPFDDFFACPLQHNDKIEQTLIVTKLGVPKETHGDVIESFFILKGQCVCTVGKHTYTLNAGDFLEILLHTEHDVKLLTPHVIAFLQHQII
jgi:mannose-6-phosphate isomerase-like protein (cupin superfamily)